MSKRRRTREDNGRRQGWLVARRLLAFGFLAFVVGSVWSFLSVESTIVRGRIAVADASIEATPATPAGPPLTDENLQRAADQLLELSNPERSENAYFADYLRDHLRWMVREHAAGRLKSHFSWMRRMDRCRRGCSWLLGNSVIKRRSSSPSLVS